MQKLLIVDDDTVIQALLKDYFEALTYEVTVAASATECLEKLRDSLYDVILMDFQISDMDATELLTTIKSDNLKRSTKIIIISGNEQAQELIEDKGLFAEAYITKPFTPKEILTKINELLI